MRSYRGAACALIIYDETSRASFLQAKEWRKDVRAHADPNLLVASKVDLVPEEEECERLQHEGEHSGGFQHWRRIGSG